jgi:NAD(P)H dehydrogenase (quinone)
MTTVVTGATGHLGRLVVEALLARGVAPGDLVATGRRTQVLDDLAARGVRVARADYDDPASLDAAFAGADRLFFASGSEVGHRIPQHRNVVDAAVRAGVRHVAYTSAPRVDVSPLPVAPDHKATEEMLAASGLPTTLLRNDWYSENYLGDLAQVRETGVLVTATAGGRVASAPRKDYAEAAAVVLTTEGHEGAVYELAGDVAWDYDELAGVLADLTGRPVQVRAVTPDERRAQLVAAGTPPEAAAFVAALDEAIAGGWLAGTDGTLARLLGHPTTPLRDTLAAG